MIFTVIIPTRDRPWLLREALQSVLDQSLARVQVIVVNDGSHSRFAQAYRDIQAQMPLQVQFINLPRTPSGHGASHARNVGATEALGSYLIFLDDDDVLTDPGYLERVVPALAGDTGPIDLHLSNQIAYRDGVATTRPIWIEDLRDRLPAQGDATGAHVVTPAMLLGCVGFAHLNTTIVSRVLFDAIGGFDTCMAYENDRDFYLRAIDRASSIKYSPRDVARHNIPDAGRTDNVSTRLPRMARMLFQLRLLDKAALFSSQSEIRDYARRHRAYVLKRLSESLYGDGDLPTARYYAWAALTAGFTMKWFAFCLLATLRAAIGPAPRAGAGLRRAVAPDYLGTGVQAAALRETAS
jgi:glycosyltransferase involved in cell wall biosynthesis